MASIDDFQADLDQLANLSDDDLTTLESDMVAAFDEADQAGDEANISALADGLDQVRTEIQNRTGASSDANAAPAPATNTAASAVSAAGETDVAPAEPAPATPPAEPPVEPGNPAPAPVDPAQEPDGTEPTDQTEEEKGNTVGASSTVAVPRDREPVLASGSVSTVVAGADIPGFSAGQVLQNGDEFGRAMAARINMLGRLNGGDGEQIIVASIKSQATADRVLDFGDTEGNLKKIQAVTNPEAITAGGGCCAPLTTRYDLFDCGGSADRPVKAALVGFQADRGGIRFYAGPELGDLNDGVGFWTCADDAKITEPGGNVEANWKQCARINCPPEQTAEIQAVTLCLTFGVLQSRIFPELAVANNKLAMVAHARIAEAALLAQIKAGSIPVTDGGTPWGAIRDLLTAVSKASMYYRDRYRINAANLRVILPVWVLEALRADITAGPNYGASNRDFYGISDADITSFFTDRNINVTFALDSTDPATRGGGFFDKITGTPAGPGNVPPAAPGTLPDWPTSVQWVLFVEGSWLYLDGGTLDLGIVRDSALVRANDYMQFSEVFESAVNIGCESLWITSTIDVSGKYACCV